jgi:hypothetical protein
MSSLQKFHRRTNGGAPVSLIGSEAPVAGGGFWLGTAGDGISKMYVAPKSTEIANQWGSYNITRGTVSTTNGLANTNTLYALGQSAHPCAYAAKTLTSGGYNTWYQPAINEMITCYSNKSATPFATANGFNTTTQPGYWTSTEVAAKTGHAIQMSTGANGGGGKNYNGYNMRAVRRSTI